jgi:hypothetical protein
MKKEIKQSKQKIGSASFRKPFIDEGILAIAIFFISLQSIYFESLGTAPFPLVGSVMIALLSIRDVRHPKHSLFQLIFGLFFAYFIFMEIIFKGRVNATLAYPFLAFTIFGAFSKVSQHREMISRALTFAIAIHIIFFVSQVVIWLLTRQYIDFLEQIIGVPQSYQSAKGLIFQGTRVPRFCGLYNEPGTFSIYVFTLIAAKYLIDRKTTIISVLSALCILASFSLFGFVLVFILVLTLLYDLKRLRECIVIIVITSVIVLFSLPEIKRRMQADYSGIYIRKVSVNLALQIENIPFGIHNLQNVRIVTNDGSVFLACLVHGGILELILFMLLAYNSVRKSDLPTKLLVLAILLTKIKLTYPLLYFFLSIAFVMKERVLCSMEDTSSARKQYPVKLRMFNTKAKNI